MRYLSVCSGIEAATVAWHPLGWTPVAFAEIDKFPAAVLAHHYPGVPNWGDMTKFKEWPDVSIDLLCGGTPCQSFSVAGLRKGLDDPRGNLMLTFGAIAAKYRPKWLVWENVPGVLSSNGGRDFGSFLGLLGVLGYGFAYRVLDAQYFGLAQRRQRVFVVGCLGDWRSAAAVLFERHSLQGHPAPSRQAGKVAPTIPSRSTAGGGLGTDFDLDGETICVATGQAGAEIGADMAPTLNCNHEAPYVAHTLRGEGFDTSEDGTGRGTPLVPHVVGALACNTGPNGHDAGNFACNQAVDAGHVLPVAYGIRTANTSSNGWGIQEEATHTLDQAMGIAVAHSLRGEGFDASEDGTGRGTPLVSVAHAFDARQSDVIQYGDQAGPLDTDGHSIAVAFHENQRGELTVNETAGALKVGGGKPGQGYPAVAFSVKDYGADAGDIAPTLRAGGHTTSHANGGVMPAVAFNFHKSGNTGSSLGFAEERTDCLRADAKAPMAVYQPHMAVRRLTPRECERLQGFPDDYTLIPYRGKPAADGPRYKALGNSMAVPCMAYIGRRIQMVEDLA